MNPRLKNLIKKCKKLGGDCPCKPAWKWEKQIHNECQAINEIQKRLEEIRKEQKELEREKLRLSTFPATIRKK